MIVPVLNIVTSFHLSKRFWKAVAPWKMSFWRNFYHWLQLKLSYEELSVQPVTKVSLEFLGLVKLEQSNTAKQSQLIAMCIKSRNVIREGTVDTLKTGNMPDILQTIYWKENILVFLFQTSLISVPGGAIDNTSLLTSMCDDNGLHRLIYIFRPV